MDYSYLNHHHQTGAVGAGGFDSCAMPPGAAAADTNVLAACNLAPPYGDLAARCGPMAGPSYGAYGAMRAGHHQYQAPPPPPPMSTGSCSMIPRPRDHPHPAATMFATGE